MPDDKLFAAADAGKLSHARPDRQPRPAACWPTRGPRDALNDFHLQWLNMVGLADMPKDPSLTDYSPEVGQADAEGDAGVRGQRVPGPQGRRQARDPADLDARRSPTARWPRSTASRTSPAPTCKPVSFDPAERAGIFTQGTFLTAKADAIDSHPIKRGDAMLNRLLCMHLEVPANIVIPPLPEPKPGPDHARAGQRPQRGGLRHLPQADRPDRLRLRELRRHRRATARRTRASRSTPAACSRSARAS